MFRWLILMVVISLVTQGFAAPVPKERRRPDSELLLGKWRVISRHYGLREMPAEDDEWNVTDTELSSRMGEITNHWKFKLLDNTNPIRFELSNNSVDYHGLLEVDGDTMRAVYCMNSLPIPTKVETNANGTHILVRLERPKPGKK